MLYNLPTRDEYCGVPMYYRIEYRMGIETLIISYRDESSQRAKIVYESPPMGGRKLQTVLRKILPTLVNGEGLLDALPAGIMERVMQAWIGLDTSESLERRKTTSGLTLGALLTADRKTLVYNTGATRKATTIKDDDRIVDKLLKRFGNIPWQEVTPQFCAEWLADQSTRAQKDCKRLMQRFNLLQMQAGLLSQLTWEQYHPRDSGHKRKSHKQSVEQQVEPVMLTDGQCGIILSQIKDRIDRGETDGIDMAILIALAGSVDYPYISALDLSHFGFLRDFHGRLTVEITHTMVKAKRNYICREIEDPYQRRKIPLPAIAADCYRALVAKRGSVELPLVSSPSNRNHRMPPNKLRLAMQDRLADVHLIRTTDVPKIKLPAVVDVLAPTGKEELKKTGIEDEELRALYGKRPLLVSAKHYYDRCNESAINKIGALQDRWFKRICPTAINKEYKVDKLVAKESSMSWVTSDPGQRTQIMLNIWIPPLPHDQRPEGGIMLELSAPHGITGTIKEES